MKCSVCNESNSPSATVCSSCGTALEQINNQIHTLSVGTKLLSGTYSIGKILGQGGFGITYLGNDLLRPVAIKELFPLGSARSGNTVVTSGNTQGNFKQIKQQFLEEGRNLAKFDHPSIVKVHNAFEDNNTAYLVMEYLRGQTLQQLMETQGGALNTDEALEYIRQVGAALEQIHQAQLLHRDIKPDNIIITQDNRALLIDFGAAREFLANKTQTHSVIITPGYAPLEQYGSRVQRGAYTDIYALAATLGFVA